MIEYDKAQWLKDLRSGEFKQCRGVIAEYENGRLANNLKTAVAFCCLGVLARQHLEKLYPDDEWLRSQGLNWTKLANLNDHSMFSFEEIADYIERVGDDS